MYIWMPDMQPLLPGSNWVRTWIESRTELRGSEQKMLYWMICWKIHEHAAQQSWRRLENGQFEPFNQHLLWIYMQWVYTEHAQFRWFIKGYNNCVESIYTSSDQASCKFNQRKATNQIKIAYHQRIIKNIMQVKTIFVKEIARREIIFIRRWSNENCAESQWIVFTVHISLAILLP